MSPASWIGTTFGCSSDIASSVSREKRSRKRSIERQLGRHQLQRDRPFQPQVVGAVDDAHPTAADQLVDPIADELGADPDLCLSAHGISRPPGPSLRRCRRPARMVDAGAEAPLSLG